MNIEDAPDAEVDRIHDELFAMCDGVVKGTRTLFTAKTQFVRLLLESPTSMLLSAQILAAQAGMTMLGISDPEDLPDPEDPGQRVSLHVGWLDLETGEMGPAGDVPPELDVAMAFIVASCNRDIPGQVQMFLALSPRERTQLLTSLFDLVIAQGRAICGTSEEEG